MWRFQITNGDLSEASGYVIGQAYSGHGAGVNNPDMQAVPDVGPIPVGLYSLGAPVDHPKLGKFAIPLIPHRENEMHGRSGFWLHGDEMGHVGEEIASHGCIVTGRSQREEIWASTDHVLQVTL